MYTNSILILHKIKSDLTNDQFWFYIRSILFKTRFIILSHKIISDFWSYKRSSGLTGVRFTKDIYIIKQDIRIYIYMFPIAGQTAGPIGLKFFVETHGLPGGVIG